MDIYEFEKCSLLMAYITLCTYAKSPLRYKTGDRLSLVYCPFVLVFIKLKF